MELKTKLKIMYSILKEFGDGNKAINQETYGIEYTEFLSILSFMESEGLIKGVKVTNYVNGHQLGWWDNAEVTMDGIKYLNDNSVLAKGYKTIKEIRDWLPL